LLQAGDEEHEIDDYGMQGVVDKQTGLDVTRKWMRGGNLGFGQHAQLVLFHPNFVLRIGRDRLGAGEHRAAHYALSYGEHTANPSGATDSMMEMLATNACIMK
jgi:hypothetical protein